MVVLAVSLALAASLSIQAPDSPGRAAAAPRLFDASEPLPFVLEGPLETIFRERGQESAEFPAKLVPDAAHGGAPLAVDVRTRGHARLRRDVCEFPPLRLDFDREDVAGSPFDGQNRLKLVTHCQNGRREYEQYVLQEYLVYRVLNVLTDLSFRARLVTATYVDTDNPGDTLTRAAFLIEDDGALAERGGLRTVDVEGLVPDVVDPAYLALVGVFEYLIGNPDWSAFAKGPEEEVCCHNTRPIGNPQRGPVFPVPYDFDVSGIVDPRYAARVFSPAERGLGITRIRQRVYRGLCRSNPLLAATLARFAEKRDAIYAVYREQPGLDPDVLEDTLEYLDEFYEVIEDPRRVERELVQRCRG